MERLLRKLVPTLLLFLLPGLASAMVINGNVISGLPPDTVIEVDFGVGEPSTARTDENGEVKITEEDDDPFGLYVPTGNDGKFDVKVAETGVILGSLTVNGPVISTGAAFAGAAEPSMPLRLYLVGEVSYYQHDDLDSSVANGASLARMDGFDVTTDADTDGYAGGLGLGVILGDGKPWHSEGSLQWQILTGFRTYEDRDGEFIASAPGITLDSSGQQELEEIYALIMMRYYIAQSLGINVGIGYSWYEFKDSGSLVRLEDGSTLNTFSDSNDDDAANFHLALSYQLTDNADLSFGYRRDLSETGANNDSEIEHFYISFGYAFGF